MNWNLSSHPQVFWKKVFWKYAANLQENTHAEAKLHFDMGVHL